MIKFEPLQNYLFKFTTKDAKITKKNIQTRVLNALCGYKKLIDYLLWYELIN